MFRDPQSVHDRGLGSLPRAERPWAFPLDQRPSLGRDGFLFLREAGGERPPPGGGVDSALGWPLEHLDGEHPVSLFDEAAIEEATDRLALGHLASRRALERVASASRRWWNDH